MDGLLLRKRLLNSIRSRRKLTGLCEEEQKSIYVKCGKCGESIEVSEFKSALNVCAHCGEYASMTGTERFEYLFDNSYKVMKFGSKQRDPIAFPEYKKKLKELSAKKGLKDAISIAVGTILGKSACVAVLETSFMMGSMGTFLGEELTRAFEYCAKKKLPIIVISASGGARMQEGIFSLMQMAKTAAAVRSFSEKRLLFISMLTNPTMGGVSASFASLGDIIIAEPGALIGFAGPRVIEQTIRQKLPDGFQRAEKLKECGFVDIVAGRKEHRELIAKILKLHR